MFFPHFKEKALKYFIWSLLIVFSLSLAYGQMESTRERVVSLQKMIDTTHAGWKAGETSMSRLSTIEFQQRLGLVIGEYADTDPKVQQGIMEAREALPSYVNWKEKGFVTPIKDQGHCGSCYAFASCALLESFYMIHYQKTLDLSEQYFMMKTKVGDLFGGCKGNNLWVCAAACIAFGAPTEECCPYKAVEESCPAPCDKNYKAFCLATGQIEGFQQVLATHGPIVVGFMVYEDFRDYKSGVYKYVHGKFLGGHAVLIVGYNKAKGYWIVKNRWGNDWGEPCDGKTGEAGYFRIAFGQCLIETPFMGPFYATK